MAAHKLPRFSKSILDKPQLIHKDKFLEIANILEDRSQYMKLREEAVASFNDMDALFGGKDSDDSVPSNIGVLRIDGPLTAKASMFEPICGGASYENLIKYTQEFISEGKDTILMHISSPGGEAFKMFSTADRIKKLCKDNDIRLVAYVDNQAASAGFGLAVIADEIIAHPESSSIGSVGVIISMVDNSSALEKAGLKRVFVSAGSAKHPYDEDGGFKDTFLGGLQKDVDKLYTKFITHVASNRGLSEELVRGTEANTYDADEALSLGFIDKTMEESELYEYLGKDMATTSQHTNTLMNKETITMTDKSLEKVEDTLGIQMSEFQAKELELNTKLAEMQSAFEAKQAEMASKLAQYEAKETEAKKADLTAFVSGLGLSNEDTIVDSMMASEGTETLLKGLIGDFKQTLSNLSTEQEAKLTELQGELEEAKLASVDVAAKATEEVSKIKEEFAAPVLVEGDNTSLKDTEDASKKSSKLADFIKNKHKL